MCHDPAGKSNKCSIFYHQKANFTEPWLMKHVEIALSERVLVTFIAIYWSSKSAVTPAKIV